MSRKTIFSHIFSLWNERYTSTGKNGVLGWHWNPNYSKKKEKKTSTISFIESSFPLLTPARIGNLVHGLQASYLTKKLPPSPLSCIREILLNLLTLHKVENKDARLKKQKIMYFQFHKTFSPLLTPARILNLVHGLQASKHLSF